ncbi:MAG: L,D-transpeptidase family protein [Planctomycetota bacterium]
MPLPSQSSRAGLGAPGRGSVYRGGRRRKRRGAGVPYPVKAGAGIIILVLGGWGIWSLLSGGGAGSPATANAAETDIVDPLTSTPVVINQANASRSPTATESNTPSTLPGSQPPAADQGGGLLGGALMGNDSNRPGVDANSTAPQSRPRPASEGLSRSATQQRVSESLRATLDTAREQIASNNPLGARETLNSALRRIGRDGPGAQTLRAELMALNDDLIFGPRVVDGDGLSSMYVIQSGDVLSVLPSRLGTGTHWKLIQRINRLSSPNRIRPGQSLKIISGPFHAIVDKSDYRLDVYHGDADSPGNWLYVTSFPVGLGEHGSTPSGRFVVRDDGKLENPAWVNPRNPSERYSGDDPKNPIGEHWVGIDGLGDDAVHTGLGIHGTIEPDSIGSQASMGCVRLGSVDVAMMYELLTEGESLVTIVE